MAVVLALSMQYYAIDGVSNGAYKSAPIHSTFRLDFLPAIVQDGLIVVLNYK